jgi:predicted dehydrogenase
LDDCNRIAHAAVESDGIFQVGLELRYAAIHRRIRSLIEEGHIGTVRQLWCKEFRGPWNFKVDNWITQKARSGGTLVEKNCHHFDLFNWFAGDKPVRGAGFGTCDLVFGEAYFGIAPDVLDNVQVVVQFEDGAVASQMDCMYCTGLEELEVGVIGTEGWLIATTNAKDRLRISRREKGEQEPECFEPPDAIRRSSHSGAVYYEHLAFAENIRNGTRPETDAEVGWWSTVVGIAAERAVEEHRVVELNEFGSPATPTH